MFDIFAPLETLTKNVIDIALTPVEIAVDMTNTLVQPMADAAKDIKNFCKENSVKELTK